MNSSSKTTDTGGTKANKTGESLEMLIESVLIGKGYTEFRDHKNQLYKNISLIGGKQYSKQVPIGTTIYESPRKCDFIVFNKELFDDGLVIECKWQQSSGSVDEKYPFLLHNIIKADVPTIILLDGGGYKKKAVEWLKDQVSPDRALIGVYAIQEFQREVNNGLLG